MLDIRPPFGLAVLQGLALGGMAGAVAVLGRSAPEVAIVVALLVTAATAVLCKVRLNQVRAGTAPPRISASMGWYFSRPTQLLLALCPALMIVGAYVISRSLALHALPFLLIAVAACLVSAQLGKASRPAVD